MHTCLCACVCTGVCRCACLCICVCAQDGCTRLCVSVPCVCTCVWKMCGGVYACAYVPVCAQGRAQVWMHTSVCMCVYWCVHLCVCVHRMDAHVCVYVCLVCTYVYVRCVQMCVHLCMCVHRCGCTRLCVCVPCLHMCMEDVYRVLVCVWAHTHTRSSRVTGFNTALHLLCCAGPWWRRLRYWHREVL